MAEPYLRIIPLGGLGEIGKNMMVYETEHDLVVFDVGLMFPEGEMLGIDLVIPDATYVIANQHKLRGYLFTHGHEDHIGALPYILARAPAPIYASRLTSGLVEVKLREHRLRHTTELHQVNPGDRFQLGDFDIEIFRVCHSIPDSVGLFLRTPAGNALHTGDWKFDYTPVDGQPTDFKHLARLGSEGVDVLLSDSTRADQPGYTTSEMALGPVFDRVMADAPGRVIVATFASLIARVQQVIDSAVKSGRKVGTLGRSMQANTAMAVELGYLRVPDSAIVPLEDLAKLPDRQIAIVCTGSQGEPTSALARMATGTQRQVQIVPGDTVVMSASPIPGNEELVNRTIDNLFKLGAQVLYSRHDGVHVGGHASQEELKLMISLLRPRHFIPIHGEFRHLTQHARIAESLGMSSNQIFVIEDGQGVVLDSSGARLGDSAPAMPVYVDGLSVGDVTQVILRDRRHLAQDGVVVVIVTVDRQTSRLVGRPDIVSRGFVYTGRADDLFDRVSSALERQLQSDGEHRSEHGVFQARIRDIVQKMLYDQARRRPMILPVVVEV